MRRCIQILLIFACSVSLFAETRTETMEERKRRIMRKYLRERVDIDQSGMVVPDTAAENEEILASEKFKDPQVDLHRQEPGTRMPPSTAARPRRRTANPNWLLADEAETEDPYANPFAQKKATDKPKKQTDWTTTWGTERDSSPYTITERESRFNRHRYDSKDTSSDDIQSQYPALDEGGLLGRQQGNQTPYSIGGLDISRDKTFDSTLNPSPFLRTPTPSTDQSLGGSGSRKQPGYTPYKSPYQTQRDQRQEQWGGYTKPEQEYRKQDPFQKWKEQNPQQFDPMRDDAFINELMPKTRR